MNYLVMISLAVLLMTGVESARDAYIAQPHNCVYHCGTHQYCNDLCKKNGATKGECSYNISYGYGCWCENLPDSVPIRIRGKCRRA
uniref:Putative alpha toxin Tx263 n=1 Tax=Buthus israelis TaxID=2899555 RepID=B8XGY0_BUTIS|nr:putative alpha toxin Tx3 [Buthus occitanus israelis]ACJ23102.1 putative alpha toxin Tx263 [Buthus occitanus israelis]